eukprot:12133685-Ditylum_brightwellii.AAC.1
MLRNSNIEQGIIANDSSNHPSNTRDAERNETNSHPNAYNPNLTLKCPIDRNIIASVHFTQGDEGLIQLANDYGHTNTDQYLLGNK